MRRRLAVLILTTILAGCAVFQRAERPSPGAQLEQGLMELRRGMYPSAVQTLTRLVTTHPDSREGRQALAVLTAAYLDPRNPGRSLNAGATGAASFVLVSEKPEWQQPIAETLYLLATEMGGRVDTTRVRQRGRLPTLSVQTLPARLTETTRERDQLRERVATLEQQLAERVSELAKAREELERIRRTIRP